MIYVKRLLCAVLVVFLAACDVPFTKEDPVVVSVGSSKLHLSEIQKQVPEWDSWDDQQRLKFLENWIEEETLYQEAVENGTDKDPVLVRQIEQTVRKIVYHAHPEMFLRGKTSISGAFLFFRDWQSADQYYRAHKNLQYDSLPELHYLVKKIEPFEMATESPDTCMIADVDSVPVGVLSKMKVCGGALKMFVVTSKLDSADALPYEEVAEDVATQAWLVHRSKVMDRLKKEWKMERPIFSKTDVFSGKEK